MRYELSSKGVRPSNNKIDAIRKQQIKDEVRSILGLVNSFFFETVLILINNNDVSRIIVLANKRYCQTEKKTLLLVPSEEHFHIYLYGKPFELITDHKALKAIFGKST